jgi:hypothetical protein
MEQVYLSRRNLMTLLAKLDSVAQGYASACTLVKTDIAHQKYPCSTVVAVTAVEDEDYYIDRAPGAVRKREEDLLKADRQS